jgi:L-lactate dehydrogenase complex protein LldG
VGGTAKGGRVVSARDAVLGKIRRSLGVSGEESRRNAAVDERLKRAPKGVIPARGQLPVQDRVALFVAMAEKTGATVKRTDSPAAPAAIAEYLRERNLPAAVRIGEDALLNGLDWTGTAVAVTHGASDGRDAVGVTHAAAAVAESGTLVLTSGPDNPTTLNFLPDTSIVVVKAADVAGDYETVWAQIRAKFGKGAMPRTVNFVTGPSRSGDIEQKILLGAHGPRRLHILVVD